ncbi:hypothetical protein M115_2769 [Bacteroides fragilis str. 3719 T6]|nr:hypothetical protein M115_2769 [Bacteroides fragilis str. 3719 T6]
MFDLLTIKLNVMNTFAVSFWVRPSKSTKAFFIAFKTDTTVTKANHLSRNKKITFAQHI